MGETLDEAGSRARRAMVTALQADGTISTPAVAEALARVPKERFVPRFYTLRPGAGGRARKWDLTLGQRPAIALLYDLDSAHAIRYEPPAGEGGSGPVNVTSTVSAPRIVGSMLELLDLQPGARVLEIGTGSGYNAAVLREAVGTAGEVTTIEIDLTLAEDASDRLESCGYDDVVVAHADGYFGCADRAPFDRVVATVGCTDVAPAWLDQLSPGGFCLLPLQHGGWHPLTRVEVDRGTGAVHGAVVGRSGFVAIQGQQAGSSPWRGDQPDRTALEKARSPMQWSSPPAWLVAALRGGGRSSTRAWDLSYLIALEDRRAMYLLGLGEDGSAALLSEPSTRLGWSGPAGSALRDRLVEIAAEWVELGRPEASSYTSRFVRSAALDSDIDSDNDIDIDAHTAGSRKSWSVDRLDHRQLVSLP